MYRQVAGIPSDGTNCASIVFIIIVIIIIIIIIINERSFMLFLFDETQADETKVFDPISKYLDMLRYLDYSFVLLLFFFLFFFFFFFLWVFFFFFFFFCILFLTAVLNRFTTLNLN